MKSGRSVCNAPTNTIMTEQLKVFQWLETVKPRVSKVTYSQYSNHIQILAKYAQEKGKEINAETTEQWLKHLHEDKKLRGKTLSIYRSIAVQYIEHVAPGTSRPLKQLLLRSAPRKRELFTPGELDRIQEVANKDIYPADGIESDWATAVKIARATALRLGDVATLRWDSVLIEEKGIRLEPHKTKRHGKVSEVPLPDEIVDLLAKRRLAVLSEYVIPLFAAEYISNGHNTLSKNFLALAKRAGVLKKSFHQIRATKITEWLAKGVTAEVISQITGQSIYQVMKYAKLSMADKRRMLGL